jgi:hypothetical protein
MAHNRTQHNIVEMKIDFLKVEKETEEEFGKIADELLNNCAIQNHDSEYRLVEIEFYWTSRNHKDDSTYQRIHTNPKNGDWFFHYSGVDIAMKNEDLDGFGGILIRGIYSLKEDKIYKGPMVCAMKLFSGTSAFEESIKTKIIEHSFDKAVVQKSPRIGLGENAKQSGTDKLNYRFFINPK